MRSLLLAGFLSLIGQTAAQTHITAYDRGPDGLEAWTDDHHTKEFRTNTEPFGIVIARHGKVIRRIGRSDGGPFFWNLMLLPDGRRIAYEDGPFHFSMSCTLMDITTGKHLEDYDCFSSNSIENGPQWVQDLLDNDREPPPNFRPPPGSGASSRPRQAMQSGAPMSRF